MLLFMKITVFDISFNRYMVECELFFTYIVMPFPRHFNRYMVECEFVYILLFFKLSEF